MTPESVDHGHEGKDPFPSPDEFLDLATRLRQLAGLLESYKSAREEFSKVAGSLAVLAGNLESATAGMGAAAEDLRRLVEALHSLDPQKLVNLIHNLGNSCSQEHDSLAKALSEAAESIRASCSDEHKSLKTTVTETSQAIRNPLSEEHSALREEFEKQMRQMQEALEKQQNTISGVRSLLIRTSIALALLALGIGGTIIGVLVLR